MRRHFLLALFAVPAISGCANAPAPQQEPDRIPQHIGWARHEWRVCEGEACPTPTPKTVILASPRPVISLPPKVVEKKPPQAVARNPIVIQFEFAKAVPTKDGMASLENAATAIHPEDSLHIEGHTDDLGEQIYNDRLARKRAEYVAARLNQRGIRIPMAIESHGKCCYAVPNESEEARARNRRVEVRFATSMEINK